MKRIKLLNLFRCSSAGRKITEKEIHYFVTDYFDGIKVEDLSLSETTLAECLGIQQSANEKKGVSHQRYCLLDQDDGEEDIFQMNLEAPLLTIIQVFINADIYQAEGFADGEEISCNNCMKKIRSCIGTLIGLNTEIHWKIYRLITEGDFAIIVRSKNIHDAYDMSTLVRNISLRVGDIDVGHAFFTYSISGILNKGVERQDENDRVGKRIFYV